jgi:hypothetical protein
LSSVGVGRSWVGREGGGRRRSDRESEGGEGMEMGLSSQGCHEIVAGCSRGFGFRGTEGREVGLL